MKEIEYFDRMINETNNEEAWSPLLWAAHSSNPELIKFLLENNAKVGYSKKDGTMALHIAASSKDPRALDVLLNHHKEKGFFDID